MLCEYFDGHLYLNTEGKLRLGLLRRDPPADLAPLPRLTASHLIDPPEIEVDGVFNRTVVACRDRARGWQPDYGQHFDSGNFFLAGRERIQNLERPWITRRETADALARRQSRPTGIAARLRVRASAAATIGVGDCFALDGGQAGPGAAFVLQCMARSMLSDRLPTIELTAEGRQITLPNL